MAKTSKRSRRSSPNRINLGSGEYPLDGWENVTLPGGAEDADTKIDLSERPWPFRSGYYDEIMASHILEHFPRDEGVEFLEECRRILKPSGTLHIAVPDMDLFIDCRLSGDYSPLEGYYWTSLDWMMGGDMSETVRQMRHHYMYCWASLAYTLQELGFEPVRRAKPLKEDNPRYRAISLYVDAVKA